MNFTEVKGSYVKENKNRKIFGECTDIIVNRYEKRVEGFVVSPKGFFKKDIILPIKAVKSIADMILFESVDKIVSDEELNKIEKILKENYTIINKKVITNKGKVLGRVNDVIFDDNTGKLEALILSDGIVSDLNYGRKRVNLNIYYSMDEEKIIIKNYDRYIEESLGGIINKISEGSDNDDMSKLWQ